MDDYRYFTYPEGTELHRKSVWRSGPNGVERRIQGGWHQLQISRLVDLIGPDEEDLKDGRLIEVEGV